MQKCDRGGAAKNRVFPKPARRVRQAKKKTAAATRRF